MIRVFYVMIEDETNNIIVSFEGRNFERAYDAVVDAMQAYIKKGSVESLDGFTASYQFDLYINYSWAISPQAVNGLKRKIENILKKF